MPIAELPHRVMQQLKLRRFLQLPLSSAATQPAPFSQARVRLLPELMFDKAAARRQRRELLAGYGPALAWEWRFDAADADVWRRAPDTQHYWPTAPFSEIDYRQGNSVGDVRASWEPARLQQLLGLAVLGTDSDVEPACQQLATELLQDTLVSFAERNPPWTGVHFVSAMECGLRVIAVAFALDQARTLAIAPSAWGTAMTMIDCHARLIEHRLSLYSSLGNHTLAEAVGLLVASRVLEGYVVAADSNRWFELGWRLLNQELPRQIRADGGPLEQANGYLKFIVDLGQLGVLLAEPRRPFSATVYRSLSSGYAFLEALPVRPLMSVGDADDGYAITPLWDSASQWFAKHQRVATKQTYPQSGYSIWQNRLRLVLDHGELGMEPGFGHGHADALSLTMGDEKGDWLIDPGTFTYTGDEEWRRYFRGTKAHNTVCVARRDQAHQVAPFLWQSPYFSRLLSRWSVSHWDCALAVHDGYQELGVLHWRGVAASDTCVVVWDALVGAVDMLATAHWHTHPEVTVHENFWEHEDGRKLHVWFSGMLNIEVFKGSEQPRLGWCSPAYGVLQTCNTTRLTLVPGGGVLRSIFSSSPEFPELGPIEAALNVQLGIHVSADALDQRSMRRKLR